MTIVQSTDLTAVSQTSMYKLYMCTMHIVGIQKYRYYCGAPNRNIEITRTVYYIVGTYLLFGDTTIKTFQVKRNDILIYHTRAFFKII